MDETGIELHRTSRRLGDLSIAERRRFAATVINSVLGTRGYVIHGGAPTELWDHVANEILADDRLWRRHVSEWRREATLRWGAVLLTVVALVVFVSNYGVLLPSGIWLVRSTAVLIGIAVVAGVTSDVRTRREIRSAVESDRYTLNLAREWFREGPLHG